MIEGAIFDVDGTILDSMEMWDNVGSDYLRSLGYTPEPHFNEIFKTFSLHQSAEYFRKNYGVTQSIDEICDGINSMVEGRYRDTVLLKDGMKELLDSLEQRNVKMCIATATDEYLVEAALKRCGVYDYFDKIFTCPALGHGKDEPLIYRECLKYLGTQKDKTIVLEDVLYAITTAKDDGFNVVAVYDKYENNQKEIKQKADIYLPNYYDLDEFWQFTSAL